MKKTKATLVIELDVTALTALLFLICLKWIVVALMMTGIFLKMPALMVVGLIRM